MMRFEERKEVPFRSRMRGVVANHERVGVAARRQLPGERPIMSRSTSACFLCDRTVALTWGDILILPQRLYAAVRLDLVVPISEHPRPAFSGAELGGAVPSFRVFENFSRP
jgi:hypothetical protein